MTQADLNAGMAALKTWVDALLESRGQSWLEWMIPQTAFSTGANDTINAADGASDQSGSGRLAAGSKALRIALDTTGEGSQVTDEQVKEAATAILAAVAKERHK